MSGKRGKEECDGHEPKPNKKTKITLDEDEEQINFLRLWESHQRSLYHLPEDFSFNASSSSSHDVIDLTSEEDDVQVLSSCTPISVDSYKEECEYNGVDFISSISHDVFTVIFSFLTENEYRNLYSSSKTLYEYLYMNKKYMRNHPIRTCNETIKRIISAKNKIGTPCFTLFHGAAGCGKSFTTTKLHRMITNGNRILPAEEQIKFVCAAPTHRAASLIPEGITCHKFVGCNFEGFKGSLFKLKSGKRFNPRKLFGHESNKYLRTVDAVLFDEASMIGEEMFYRMDIICRHVRSDNRPFGGIHVILSGDFAQLPPVGDTILLHSPLFRKFPVHVHSFNYSYRHMTDPKFSLLLKRIRSGQTTDRDIDLLMEKVVSKEAIDSMVTAYGQFVPPQLYHTHKQIFEANQTILSKCPGKTYMSVIPEFTYLEKVYLDRVIFEYVPSRSRPIPENTRKKIDKEFKIFPLKAGCQYICTETCGNNGLYRGKILVLRDESFYDSNGRSYTLRDIPKRSQNFSLGGRYYVRVKSFCIIPGYAVSFHGSQGMTLERVVIGCESLFTKALYVALSRATTFEGLYLSPITRDKLRQYINVNKEVAKFFTEIEKGSDFLTSLVSNISLKSEEELRKYGLEQVNAEIELGGTVFF